MASDERVATAPYISFRTFLNLLDRLDSGGIPQHIDRHYWGSFFAGTTGQQTMAALRFLGLITPETNEPTAVLERLVAPDERKTALRELLRERYAAIWESNVDPARTTPGHLENAIGNAYKVEGETRRKALTFFVHAAKYAELPLSPQVTAKTRQRRTPSTSSRRTRPKSERQAESPASPPPTSRSEPGLGLDDYGPYGILHSLLRQLPPEGKWTSERRDKWLRVLEASVDFLVTVEEPAPVDDFYFEDEEEAEAPE